jgi:hypothetical protein
MGATTRFIVRWGLIGGLAVGGITLLVGPQRVMACIDQIRQDAGTVMDGFVDDPVALRRQLDSLAKQYPKRIAEVRGELARLDLQLEQLRRDEQIAIRVVELTSSDLDSLRNLVEEAESLSSVNASGVTIWFEGLRYDLEDAYVEGRRIRTVRANYEDRLMADRRQTELMQEQKVRLVTILEKVVTEHETYRTQLWQLDREIDAIERNEHIIAMVEQQQDTLASFSRGGKANNLTQVRAKLAEIRTVQESTIIALTEIGQGADYETRARFDTADRSFENPFDEKEDTVEVDEIDPLGPYALLDSKD